MQNFTAEAFRGLVSPLDVDTIDIQIKYNNLNKLYSDKSRKVYVKADLVVDGYSVEKLKAKIRAKGDREIHFYDKDTMSTDKLTSDYNLSLEEFSIQRPIVKGIVGNLC